MKKRASISLPVALALLAISVVCSAPSHAQGTASALRRQDGRGAGVRSVVSDQRVALVIGNADYNQEIGKLKNPTNDAADVAAALKRLGFTLVGGKAHLNLNKRQMLEQIRDFGSQLQRGGVGVFYFGGHGVQVDKHNYLIPITDQLQYQEDAEYEAVDADMVLREMEAAENSVKILILDACRNNNLPKKRRTTTNGLTEPARKPEGILIAFSTADGQTASDNSEGRNGLFTQELLKYIETPNLPLDRIFRTIRNEVKQLSKNTQLPFLYQSLSEDVFLNTTESIAAPPPPKPSPNPTISKTPASRPPNAKPDAQTLAQRALAEMMNSNDASASKLATDALKINGQLPLALAVSGQSKLYRNSKEGRSELERAVRLEPHNPFPLALLAYFFRHDYNEKTYQADQESAKRLANQVLTLEPKADVDYFARGIARKIIVELDYGASSEAKNKIWTDTVAEFTKAIELNRQFVIAYGQRAWAYYELEKYDEAIADFSKVIEMKPNGASGYSSRGFIYTQRRKDYENAIKDFNKVIEIATNVFAKAQAFNSRGDVYFKKEEYDKAIADFTQAILLDPKDHFFYSDRAQAYEKIGRKDLAEADRKKADKLQ